MKMEPLLDKAGNQSWFRLDQLIEAVLADVIAADANFQLTQAKAWSDFSASLNELNQLSNVERIELGVGFGRLENLGLSELSVSLPLEVYRPGWLRRCWWGAIRLFGGKGPGDRRFRVAERGSGAVMELLIKARRDAAGRWTVESQEDNQ